MEPLTREEIEIMRGWIRHYYKTAGHERSANMADRLCDMALASLGIPSQIMGLYFRLDPTVPDGQIEVRDGVTGRLVGIILNVK